MKKLIVFLLIVNTIISCTTSVSAPRVDHGAFIVNGQVYDLREVKKQINGHRLSDSDLMLFLSAEKMMMDGKEGFVHHFADGI